VVEFWRYGPSPVPGTNIGAFAQKLESIGWDGLAVGENNKQPDLYALLALVSTATTTLKVGTATAVPTRHPMLAAVSMATIQGLSQGRAHFSLARGDSAVKALQQRPMPVDEFGTYLQRLQAYLRREQVEIDGKLSTIADLTLVDPSLDRAKPTVDVAAAGPRMIRVAAEYADSVSFAVGADPPRLQQCIERAREACEASGRNVETLGLGCYVQVAVGEGEDKARAREGIRALAITFARFSGYEGKALADVRDDDRSHIQRAVEGMDARFRANTVSLRQKPDGLPGELEYLGERDQVDDEFIDRFAIIGSATQCAERLSAIAQLGIQRIYLGTRFLGTDVGESNTFRVAEEVLPLLRSTGN
jgi:5,10-methylenetetrahydromethanopterin reductase